MLFSYSNLYLLIFSLRESLILSRDGFCSPMTLLKFFFPHFQLSFLPAAPPCCWGCGMSLCGRKALTLLSSVFAVCALGLLGIAVSTDYWLYLEEGVILPLNQSTEIRMSLHSGLWRVCFLAGKLLQSIKHIDEAFLSLSPQTKFNVFQSGHYPWNKLHSQPGVNRDWRIKSKIKVQMHQDSCVHHSGLVRKVCKNSWHKQMSG